MKKVGLTSLKLIVPGALMLAFVFVLDTGYVMAKNKVKSEGGGPPPWAPAHGYRRKFQYYPKQKVYYRPDTKQYFWIDAGAVKVGTKLPSWISISGSGTTAELDTDKPLLVNFK